MKEFVRVRGAISWCLVNLMMPKPQERNGCDELFWMRLEQMSEWMTKTRSCRWLFQGISTKGLTLSTSTGATSTSDGAIIHAQDT